MMVYRLWLFEECHCNMDKHYEGDNMIRDDTSLMDDDEAEEGRSCYDWPMAVEDNYTEVVLALGILLLLYCCYYYYYHYYYYRET